MELKYGSDSSTFDTNAMSPTRTMGQTDGWGRSAHQRFPGAPVRLTFGSGPGSQRSRGGAGLREA